MTLEQQAKFPWQWPGSKTKRPIENDDPKTIVDDNDVIILRL